MSWEPCARTRASARFPCPKVSFASHGEVGARAVTSQCVELPGVDCSRRELLPLLGLLIAAPLPFANRQAG